MKSSKITPIDVIILSDIVDLIMDNPNLLNDMSYLLYTETIGILGGIQEKFKDVPKYLTKQDTLEWFDCLIGKY